MANYFEILNGTMLSNAGRIYHYFKDKQKLITVSDKGFGISYNSAARNDLQKTGIAAAVRHTNFDTDIFSRSKKIVEKIIEWSEKRNVKLIFITLPAYHTYRDMLNKNQLNQTINYMKFIDGGHDNVYYYNFLDDESFTAEHFFDADHLNQAGAVKMTGLISGIIMNIIRPGYGVSPLIR